jgi:threonine/homoserine/homoserine lactone efflux protein
MTAAMLGLAAVLHTSALAFAALKWCGVLYLLYMAWQALRERGRSRSSRAPWRGARAGGSSSPDPDQHPQPETVDLLPEVPAAVHRRRRARSIGADAGIERRLHGDDLAVFVLYGLFAAGVRDHVITRPRVMAWLRRSFAAGFAALGAKLAFAER